MESPRLLVDFAVALLAALVAGVACIRLRQPVLVGYLLAGIAIGPHGLGWIHDKLIIQQREAPNEEAVQRLSWQIEEIAQERATEIPTWETPLYRYFHTRWMRWPADGNVKMSREAPESFVWWIDDDIKEETLKAMREGRSFGETSRVFDQYQDKP